jgi:NADPH:quinone reductase-like Zn-dependent oxidoreductase
MRAYVLEAFDAQPRIVGIPLPHVGDDDVLVRVLTSSVNPHEAHVISGSARRYLEYQFPVTLGTDVAGVVEEVGRSVSQFRPGDKVFGVLREKVAHRGTLAEYVALPAASLVPQPPGVDDAQAGAVGLASMAAMACLDAVPATAGESILIVGATGGVGSCAIQLASLAGVRVIATARAGREEDFVRAQGASEIVDWARGDLGAIVRDRHADGIVGIVNLVTPDPTEFARLAKVVLRPGGFAVSTLGAADPAILPGVATSNVVATADPAALRRIAGFVAAGALVPSISEVFRFEDIDEALVSLARGTLGKISIQIGI